MFSFTSEISVCILLFWFDPIVHFKQWMFTLQGQENVWYILTVKSVVNSGSWKNVYSTSLLSWSLLESSDQQLLPSLLILETKAIQLLSLRNVVRFLEFILGLCPGFYINFLLGWAVKWLWNFSFIFQVAGSDEDKRQEQMKGFPSQYYLEVSELCLVLFLCSHRSHHPEFIVIWLLSKTCSEDQTLKPSWFP